MIELKNVSKKFDKFVLKDLSLQLPKDKISIIVGINGSGKTTLMECITGLKNVSSGTIKIDGHDNDSVAFKEKIFYIPSEFYLPNYMTGYEYLDFVLKRYPNSNRKDINSFVKLFDLAKDIDKLIESYSLGMKKKIQIIAASLANTEYILGDEIFNGLDFETTLVTVSLFNKLAANRGLILISHSKLIIDRFSQNILLLSDGTISSFKGSSSNLENKILSMEVIDDKVKFIQEYFITD